MNLKNYTSGVPAQRTIADIEALLMTTGATRIAKEVKDKAVVAIMFEISMDERAHIVKLPANVEAVQDWLWREHVTSARRNRRTKEDLREQAERTAWKIMLDWTQVQISLIQLRQAEPMQVFLPYIWDGNQTYYEFLKGNKFKALPAPSEP